MLGKVYKYGGKTFKDEFALLCTIAFTTGEDCGYPFEDEELARLGIEVIYTDPEEEKSLSERKKELLSSLDQLFEKWRNDEAVLISSLGFKADADSRAMQDISGLWTVASEDADFSATFMDADNSPHELNRDSLKTLRDEIIKSASDAYTQKWAFREEINAAKDRHDLARIFIWFKPSDFSKNSKGD